MTRSDPGSCRKRRSKEDGRSFCHARFRASALAVCVYLLRSYLFLPHLPLTFAVTNVCGGSRALWQTRERNGGQVEFSLPRNTLRATQLDFPFCHRPFTLCTVSTSLVFSPRHSFFASTPFSHTVFPSFFAGFSALSAPARFFSLTQSLLCRTAFLFTVAFVRQCIFVADEFENDKSAGWKVTR